MIDEDFRTLILAQSLPIGTACEKGKNSEETAATRVWYQRSNANTDLHLNGNTGLVTTVFDVECESTDESTAEATVQSICATLKTALHGFRGAAANSSILGIFVEDHSDDYQPFSLDSDTGYDIATFRAEVHHL